MSNKERAIQLLDQIPESKMYYILGILEGAAIPDEVPNEETQIGRASCRERVSASV